MPNQLLAMQLVRSILLLLERGYSERAVHRELKISRTTIRRYLERFRDSRQSYSALLQLKDSDLVSVCYGQQQPVTDVRKEDFRSRMEYFLSELKRTGVTRLLLWEEYQKEYRQGYGYSKFCELLKEYGKVKEASMHFSYQPAEVMMIDFAGDKLSYVDRDSGEIISCPVLVAVLPYSGYSYAIALANATLPQVVKGLNQCLRYFGGVPYSLKCDNMKQIVSRSCRYEPVFTEVIQQWALHYQISLVAARPGKPKDKALVENEVKLTYQRIYAPLRNEVFFSLEELNGAIEKQRRLHHERPFRRKGYSRQQGFISEEQELLQGLPDEDYFIRHRVNAKVQKNYHITLGEDWHHYSVPYTYIGKMVQAVYDTDSVEVYFQHQRIAFHRRNYRKHGYTTLKEHMPEGHQRYFEQKGWDARYFLSQAEQIGTAAHQYIQQILKGKRFTEQTYNACLGLLRLGKTYGNDRLEAACKRALKGRSYTYRIVHNILENNLDTQEADSPVDLFSVPQHDNLRGPREYQ
jgi:transposase